MNQKVADVSTGRGHRALQYISLDRYIDHQEFFGAKRHVNTANGLSNAQQISLLGRIDFYNANRIEYDGNHLDQSGTFFEKTWYRRHAYWEFDCVGFVERIFEDIQINLTDNKYENGAGWPLTVREQRDSPHRVVNVL